MRVCVFFCNVFLYSIFTSFVTYNSTNLQVMLLISPRDKESHAGKQ